MFRKEFAEAASLFKTDAVYIDALYQDITKHYTAPNRYYHTLQHLEDIISELLPVKAAIKDWPILVFAIAYHDVIYNVLKQNNEEKSAAYAKKMLQPFLSIDALEECQRLIMATKSHQVNINSDANYFIDADLSILGAAEERYHLYRAQIRKEYKYYPDIVYKPGRQKVLHHFLSMDRIFKSDYFYEKYEAKARNNLKKELEAY